jgi:hypothetical protein
MAGTSLRAQLVDALTAALPVSEWAIVGYADIPARIEKRTVVVWAAQIEPVRLKAGQYSLEMQVRVITPHQDVEKADDDLDGALLAVLDILLGLRGVTFDSAERQADNGQHWWAITTHYGLAVTPETPED